jgi:putative aldouronate transport system substrate-binding protein
VETIKFMDWLMSEEGQYVTQWGPEGVTWNYVDGKRVLTDEA